MRYLLVLLFITTANAQNHSKTLHTESFVEYDTVRPMFYTLKWGNTQFVREYPETLYCHYDKPAFIGENNYAMVIQVTPANYGWYALVLPLNDSTPPTQFNQAYDYDIQRNLIAHCDEEQNIDYDDSALVVENFVTREKQYFPTDSCNYSSFGNCCMSILKAEIGEDSLYYQWQHYDRNNKEPSYITKSRKAPLRLSDKLLK